jgi:2-dehydropantoate 2-reductase
VRTAIVGSGAMGQLFGARLLMAGTEVVFLDTNPGTLEALNSRGVTLHTDLGVEHTSAKAARASELGGEFGLFIVFTKGFHTQAAVDSVSHLIGADSIGLTLQNGLGNAEVLQQAFGAERTLLGMTDFPADMEEPGVISSNSQGKVRLGSLSQESSAAGIARLLDSAGLHAAVDDDIRVPVWEKVAFNAALNTLSAVTGMTVGQIGEDPHARNIVRSVLDECMAVAQQQGINLSRQRIESTLANAFAHHTHHKTSMLLDREAGRPTEVDTIGGAVVRLGREHGIDTPVLETLCELVRTNTVPGAGR